MRTDLPQQYPMSCIFIEHLLANVFVSQCNEVSELNLKNL